MKSIIRVLCVSFSLSLVGGAVGCGDKASCEKVTDHMLSLLPAEAKGQISDKDKKEAVEKCKKDMTKEQRECAIKAKGFEDLMKCESAGKK